MSADSTGAPKGNAFNVHGMPYMPPAPTMGVMPGAAGPSGMGKSMANNSAPNVNGPQMTERTMMNNSGRMP